MRIDVDVDELAFLHPKSREDVERELLEAGITDLVNVLLSAPAVGEDTDFERIQDLGRPELEWDT